MTAAKLPKVHQLQKDFTKIIINGHDNNKPHTPNEPHKPNQYKR